MVGIYGYSNSTEINDFYSQIPKINSENTETYKSEDISISIVTHGEPKIKQYGSLTIAIFGFISLKNKIVKNHKDKQTQLVYDLYQKKGLSFINEVDGEFIIIMYDENGGKLKLFTDKIGSQPLYYTISKESTLYFSSHIQSLIFRKDNPNINEEAMLEFFGCQRSYGIDTPIAEVKQFPPASINTVELDNSKIELEQEYYWMPEYKPVTRSYSKIVDEFLDILNEVLEDLTDNSTDYGVLLSGGSDSRLLLAELEKIGRDVTAYHINDWMNREAQTAKRVADELGVEFHFLRRDSDYIPSNMTNNLKIHNFIGKFPEARLNGFRKELKEKDVLISGWTADTFFKGHFIPDIKYQIQSINEFFYYINDEYYIPEFLDSDLDLYDILSNNYIEENEQIIFHGVQYPNFSTFINSVNYFPLTNQDDLFFHTGLRQMTYAWCPFLDHRLIDLHLSIPQRYQEQNNIIKDSIKQNWSYLDDIPYNPPNSGLEFEINLIPGVKFSTIDIINQENRKDIIATLKRKIFNKLFDRTYTSGAWQEGHAIQDNNDFIPNSINSNIDTINKTEFLDMDAIMKWYEQYGTEDQKLNHANKLYLLVTFLEMPATAYLMGSSENK